MVHVLPNGQDTVKPDGVEEEGIDGPQAVGDDELDVLLSEVCVSFPYHGDAHELFMSTHVLMVMNYSLVQKCDLCKPQCLPTNFS